MVRPNQSLALNIEKPAAGGRMLARANGQVVLVAGAIPGERVTARVERVSRGVVFAEATTIDAPSPDRRAPFDDPLCGGCVYSHIAYRRQLELKSAVIADAFRRIGHLDVPGGTAVAGSSEDGYRMRARLHVRDRRLGFFRENTHEICDPRTTRQLLPATCDALELLMAAMRSLGLDAVRAIELSENIDASDRVVYLDAGAEVDPHAIVTLAGTDGFTGIASAFGVQGQAHVVDRLQRQILGSDPVSDPGSDLGSDPGGRIETGAPVTVALRRHVLAFFQGNRHLLGDLVAQVVERVPAGGEVLDLYAGVGLFSVSAATARGVHVTAVEGDRYAAEDLVANAANAGETGGSVIAVHQSVENFLATVRPDPGHRRSTVIVDPPRTGLSKEALDGVLRLKAPRLIYVSCDVATLARDARRTVDAGYTIERVDAFDMFPNTPHVETVVVFDRR